MRIRIKIGDMTLYAKLGETETAKKVWEILPFRSKFNTWGDEIYFSIPVDEKLDETARDEVEIGDIGYWPDGKAFCIFFGPTPISKEERIIPASAVNIIGKIEGNPACLRNIKEDEIILEKA